MAQQLTVTTLYARQQMAKARAEGGKLTKITKMAFGNGGTNDKGEPVALQGNEQALKNELLQRKSTALSSWSRRKSAIHALWEKANWQERRSTSLPLSMKPENSQRSER